MHTNTLTKPLQKKKILSDGQATKPSTKPTTTKFVAKKLKPKPTHFYLRILSRHPSVGGLRNKVLVKGAKAVYRHGSTSSSELDHEINSVESVKISADKKLMKEAFDKAEVRHAPWIELSKSKSDPKVWKEFLDKLKFGADKESWLIVKQRWGSRGVGEISFG